MNKHYATIEQALHYLLEHRDRQPSLAEVAEHCHLSEFHFQRIFTQWAGVSPKRFLQCLNRDYARSRLTSGSSVQGTTDMTGLSSTGRLHDLFVSLEAITPGDIKSAGENILFTCGIHPTPFGDCFIALTERGIHQLAFVDPSQGEEYQQALKQQWPAASFNKKPQLTQTTIDSIFKPNEGAKKTFKLWIKGSPFQFKVWEALLAIEEGQLSCYSDIAKDIGQASAARAVGSAVAKNPIAYLIPCHRVIKNMGVLGNYRWGEARKQAIIGRELSANAR
jgi:AraC family transcriptional regulator of adaptative response/methylated-DNA-[protein]-cysteine methyltransferase